jgi:hypothetical protein
MDCLFKVSFIVLALIASAFYGYFGQTILGNGGKHQTPLSERKSNNSDGHHWSWWIHQIWINFAGSLIGWSALYCLIFCRDSVNKLTVAEGFLMLVAVVGLFGFLPWRLYNVNK